MYKLGWALISNALVAVLWLDFKFKIIPDEIQLLGLCGAILTCVFGLKFIGFINIGIGIALPFLLIILNFIYNKVNGKEGIGQGDIKLLLWLALIAGSSIFKVFTYSIILAIPFSLIVVWKKGRHEAFPYGPWIVFSFIAIELMKSENQFQLIEYSKLY
ncbi:MAG: prepilin peptidase [Bacteriovoracaceae bacterium]|nr:prepilin peptidase [Bacteriovoracaceae bacterium]